MPREYFHRYFTSFMRDSLDDSRSHNKHMTVFGAQKPELIPTHAVRLRISTEFGKNIIFDALTKDVTTIAAPTAIAAPQHLIVRDAN